MGCKKIRAHIFKKGLGFKSLDIILIKEQSVLTKIISSFEEKIIQTQYKVFCYMINLLICNFLDMSLLYKCYMNW